MEIKEFVHKCGEILSAAKPHLKSCEYKNGAEITDATEFDRIVKDDDYVVVTCENGYKYYVDVSGSSLCAIAEAIFSKMAHK